MIVFLYQQNRFRITINLNERIVENEGIFLHYGGDGSDDDDDDDDGIKNNQHEPKGNHVAENKDSYNLICKQMWYICCGWVFLVFILNFIFTFYIHVDGVQATTDFLIEFNR